jgi:hypothetical protein
MPSPQIESVEVVATLLVREPKFLAVFNPRWGAFTFPMSRRKQFLDPTVSLAATPEKLERAAARVAAEVLGRSFSPEEFPRPLCKIKEFEQSDADGVWKLYQVHVFGLTLAEGAKSVPGLITEWLTREDFQTREPVTHTARYLLQELATNGKLPPWTK